MAKKIYDEKISKSTDWGGDESTGGLPVAGGRIQEYLKEQLDGKAVSSTMIQVITVTWYSLMPIPVTNTSLIRQKRGCCSEPLTHLLIIVRR